MKKIIISTILLGALFVVGCTSISNTNSKTSYKNLSVEELNGMMNNKDFVLIDVHIPTQEHIVGTDLSIPYTAIVQRMNELPKDKSAKIVLYCRSGYMSVLAAEELAKQGYTNVYNLVGGRNAWVAQGFN
ncbi:MAG: rhodanese-like domain-containing protein [Candidatus Woesearchaeota archaeon]